MAGSIPGRMNSVTYYVLLGAMAAGFVQGLSGFAFGLVAMTFWVWVIPPQLAGPLVVFGSLVGQLLSLGSMRRGFDRQRFWPFVLGGCAGTPIGVCMLHYVDPTQFKMAIGLILLAYCPLMLFIGATPRITAGGRWADGGVGLIGGFMEVSAALTDRHRHSGVSCEAGAGTSSVPYSRASACACRR